MKCIICKKEELESEEHIIPEALGNKKLITKRVCAHCNNKLGTNVDNYLTNHTWVKILRIKNKVLGKKGKDIKFFSGVETDINTGQKYYIKKIYQCLSLEYLIQKMESLKLRHLIQMKG